MRCRFDHKAGHLVLHLGGAASRRHRPIYPIPGNAGRYFRLLRADCSADQSWARRVCGLRMLRATNSKKRLETRAPAAAISAGTRPCGGVTVTRLEFMPKPPVREMRNNCARRCGSLTRIPCDFPRGTRLQARPLDQTQPLLRRAERIARSRSKSVRGFGSLMRRSAPSPTRGLDSRLPNVRNRASCPLPWVLANIP